MRAPGPSATGFLYSLLSQGFLSTIGEQWRAHGDVFLIQASGRRLLFAIHPDAVQQVNQDHRQRYAKVDSYDMVRRYLVGNGLVASNGELWKRQRRLMAPFFTRSGVWAFAELMLRDSLHFTERWEGLAGSGAELDMGEEMTRITASIILRAMFSAATPDDIDRMQHTVQDMVAFVNRRMVLPDLPLWVPTPGNLRYRAARDFAHGYTAELIAQRRAVDEADWPEDLLTKLMKARDPDTGEPMSEVLLRDESITVFFAGHETTARTMTFAWYALASFPEVMERLHAELDAVLGDRPPTLEDLKQLPYTLQVVKEVLRLYPAIPFYARDAVEDDSLGGYEVPAGTAVMFASYFTHRHPDFWEEPERFDPDRWTPEREQAQHKYAFHPFAAGPRTCIGNNFSLLETHILLAVLAQRFRPVLRAGYTPRWEMQGVLSLEDGLPMRLERR
ncbi:MAG: cytochrome P450 [Alphaproteobacteria bacterium]|nr:cytochrome P450 [Alphaproteobacteria bacterium]MCB9791489.1 cytochrome P450 [Alphaproteobacteria bacterium]